VSLLTQSVACAGGTQVAISETNFPLANVSDIHDWNERFAKRGIELAAQTMTLLRYPGLVLTRQLFDWGVPQDDSSNFRFQPPSQGDPPTPEMEVYRAFGNFSGATRAVVNVSVSAGAVSDVALLGVEAVCVAGRSPELSHLDGCSHAKVAFVNEATVQASASFRWQGMGAACVAANGLHTTLTAETGGAFVSAGWSCAAGAEHQSQVQVPARSLVVLECRCD
jgi:hypothetical protein